ncbi:hypothetical protein DPMN_046697 [Dreissena polymorpha]|uniref:Uncharacterized protein n=1 Tax=Dreissena polymorpha TaxID=45954 RepID=A0A9D4I146_DREPO|nr:hypothetical protein DPMN_046697 [Dreissena polymorpha]
MIDNSIRLFDADDSELFSLAEVPLDNKPIQRDTDSLSQWGDTWLREIQHS